MSIFEFLDKMVPSRAGLGPGAEATRESEKKTKGTQVTFVSYTSNGAPIMDIQQ